MWPFFRKYIVLEQYFIMRFQKKVIRPIKF